MGQLSGITESLLALLAMTYALLSMIGTLFGSGPRLANRYAWWTFKLIYRVTAWAIKSPLKLLSQSDSEKRKRRRKIKMRKIKGKKQKRKKF